MDLGAIIQNMVERERITREERRRRLASKVLTCPKCKGTSILVEETIEATSQHVVENGVWQHRHDNNEYGNGIRIDCICNKCGHSWHGRRGLDFSNYYLTEG